jgi:hypothetical protein
MRARFALIRGLLAAVAATGLVACVGEAVEQAGGSAGGAANNAGSAGATGGSSGSAAGAGGNGATAGAGGRVCCLLRGCGDPDLVEVDSCPPGGYCVTVRLCCEPSICLIPSADAGADTTTTDASIAAVDASCTQVDTYPGTDASVSGGCVEETGLTADQVDSLRTSCSSMTSDSGTAAVRTFSTEPCSRSNVLGGCRITRAGFVETFVYYTDGMDSESIKATCASSGGTFTWNP